MTNTTPLKLEAGKRYIRRNGSVSGELKWHGRFLQDPYNDLVYDPRDEIVGFAVLPCGDGTFIPHPSDLMEPHNV